MLKKRNMAVAMAAVTVATTVAPAFAGTLDGTVVSSSNVEKMAELRTELKGYFDTKYSKDTADLNAATADTCTYTITVQKNGKGGFTPLANIAAFDKLVANLKSDEYIKVQVVDKGFKEVDGKIVDWKTIEYVNSDMAGVETAAKALLRDKTLGNVDNPVIAVDVIDSKGTVSIKLANNDEPLVVKVGDAKLKLAAKTDAIYKTDEFGNALDKDGNITTKDADKVVLGFKKERDTNLVDKSINADDFDYDSTPKTFTVKYGNVNEVELNASDLYETKIGRFTAEGNELVKFIKEYNAEAKRLGKKVITKDTFTSGDLSLTLNVPEKLDGITSRTAGNYATIVVKGTKSEMEAFNNALGNNLDGSGATIKTLAGKNRQETALEVSKEKFTTVNATTNVVLVSDYATADGLTATPFANAVNAPILLTSKDGMSKEVMEEVERLTAQGGKVYLVGGDAVLSENIENQLDAKYIKHERIAGTSRQETSLEIAKRISKLSGNTADRVFVTGGYAEADAMSIAGVAATKDVSDVDPILLVGNEGLTASQAKWLKQEDIGTNAVIVGGDAKVSSNTEGQLADAITGKIERIAGTNRQETNAKVINKFYTANTKVYVAKSDDKGLVDALPGGVAAAIDQAPVILATEDLHASQEAALKQLTGTNTHKTQVGYGVAAQVWSKIKAIF